jgi:hypothetical protein
MLREVKRLAKSCIAALLLASGVYRQPGEYLT